MEVCARQWGRALAAENVNNATVGNRETLRVQNLRAGMIHRRTWPRQSPLFDPFLRNTGARFPYGSAFVPSVLRKNASDACLPWESPGRNYFADEADWFQKLQLVRPKQVYLRASKDRPAKVSATPRVAELRRCALR